MFTMAYITYSNQFASIPGDDASKVFEVNPRVFRDARGSFSEVLKDNVSDEESLIPAWFKNQSWIKQVNRSISSEGTVRGFHAQRGSFCQGKLVEAVNEKLYDIIIDGRPNSSTFGNCAVFILDPEVQNKLWVPRGFLHSFVTPLGAKKNFIFQYFCDNVYSHESEFGISPLTVLPLVSKKLEVNDNNELNLLVETIEDTSKLNLSEKDLKGIALDEWLIKTKHEFEQVGKAWYK